MHARVFAKSPLYIYLPKNWWRKFLFQYHPITMKWHICDYDIYTGIIINILPMSHSFRYYRTRPKLIPRTAVVIGIDQTLIESVASGAGTTS